MKVLYAGGHLAEFAVFDLDELAVARVNRYRVALDRADVAARMERVHAASSAEAAAVPDLGWHAGQFLTALVVGAGRDARGERLSGHQFLRATPWDTSWSCCRPRLPHAAAARLDSLDPYRRFELARPDLGRDLEAALRQPVPAVAKALLDIAIRELPELVPVPARAAVGRVLAGDRRSTI